MTHTTTRRQPAYKCHINEEDLYLPPERVRKSRVFMTADELKKICLQIKNADTESQCFCRKLADYTLRMWQRKSSAFSDESTLRMPKVQVYGLLSECGITDQHEQERAVAVTLSMLGFSKARSTNKSSIVIYQKK